MSYEREWSCSWKGREGNVSVHGGERVENSQLNLNIAGGNDLEQFPLSEMVESIVVLDAGRVSLLLITSLIY